MNDTICRFWLLPDDTDSATASLSVTEDGAGVVASLSVDLPADADTTTPAASLEALVAQLAALSASMKGGRHIARTDAKLTLSPCGDFDLRLTIARGGKVDDVVLSPAAAASMADWLVAWLNPVGGES